MTAARRLGVTAPQLPDPPAGRVLVPDALLATALAFTIFYPIIAARLHGTLTPQILLLLLIWVNAFVRTRAIDLPVLSVIALGTGYTAFGLVLARLLVRTEGPLYAVSFQRLFVVLPLSAVAAWTLVRAGRWDVYLKAFLGFGVITVPPAILEFVLNANLLRSDHKAFVRNGETRAVVGTEHPLVLGALLVALIPIAAYLLRDSWWRYPTFAALYVGVFVTGSNGPVIVGAAVLIVCVAPPVARLLLDFRASLLIVLAGLGTWITVGALVLWSPQIYGTTTTEVSNGYRGALYNFLPRLLSEHPFGYGFRGLPSDTFFVYTTGGTVDVATSIDSEFVYAAGQFGWLAMIVFVAIALLGALAATRHHAIGLSSLSLTLIGLFLAIHSWNSLGAFWALGMGACAAVVFGDDRPRGSSWRGLSTWRRPPPSVPVRTERPLIAAQAARERPRMLQGT